MTPPRPGTGPRPANRPGPPADRYGGDVLAARPGPRVLPDVPARLGEVVEDVETGFVGAVVGCEVGTVTLEDRRGRRRAFPLGPGFWIDGAPVRLVAPKSAAPVRSTRTASGSVAVHGARARVARGSRIWVEGKHDAELVEKVWGDDLRVEGVVVEPLDGVDLLPEALAEFGPGPGRRVGVLVDHLVAGSKESRIAASVAGPHVLVVGHPYVDIWQAVRPARVGLAAWPVVPRSVPWKEGVCDALGWPHRTQIDLADAWRRILASVRTYADLEPTLLGRVEELIDFVTAPGAAG